MKATETLVKTSTNGTNEDATMIKVCTLDKLLKIRTTDSNSPPPNFLNQWGHAYSLNSFCCLDDPLPINEGSDYDGEGDVTLNSNISSHFHGSGV